MHNFSTHDSDDDGSQLLPSQLVKNKKQKTKERQKDGWGHL
jgi:hypothetical protein